MTDSPFREISKRNVIVVDIDEEITSIFERIQQKKSKTIFLLVPSRCVLFQSMMNLQILKKNVEEEGKTLSIITHDETGKKLCLQIDLPVFDQVETSPKPLPKEGLDEEIQTPIAALSNPVDDDSPQKLSKKKISIFDIVQKSKNKYRFSSKRWRQWIARMREKRAERELSRFSVGVPTPKTLGTLIVASLSILFVISYVALPGATVTIIPQAEVLEQGVNVVLADANRYGTSPSSESGYAVAAYPIEITVNHTLLYDSTGQIFDGTNASGYVTFINERPTPWPLVALTRIQTEDGLVFRTQEPITVPAAQGNEFGTADALVVADEVDAFGRVIGERGNIESSSFFLPGLREESRATLYARSNLPMTGGSTVVTLKVTEQDLEASEALMEETLEAMAVSALESEVAARNATENAPQLALLTGYGSIEMETPSVDVPTYLVEAIQDQFEVSGQMQVSGWAYEQDQLLTLLEAQLLERKSPDKILTKIDRNSLSYEVVEDELPAGQIKITATIKGLQAYALDPSDEYGARLIKKIKEHIAGKTLAEAEDYVQQLPEVNKVNISSWPVWAPTVPTVFDNIEVKIDEEWLEEVSG